MSLTGCPTCCGPCRVPHVACPMQGAPCSMSHIGYPCGMPHLRCPVSHVPCQVPHVAHPMQGSSRAMSRVGCPMCSVPCEVPPRAVPRAGYPQQGAHVLCPLWLQQSLSHHAPLLNLSCKPQEPNPSPAWDGSGGTVQPLLLLRHGDAAIGPATPHTVGTTLRGVQKPLGKSF